MVGVEETGSLPGYGLVCESLNIITATVGDQWRVQSWGRS